MISDQHNQTTSGDESPVLLDVGRKRGPGKRLLVREALNRRQLQAKVSRSPDQWANMNTFDEFAACRLAARFADD